MTISYVEPHSNPVHLLFNVNILHSFSIFGLQQLLWHFLGGYPFSLFLLRWFFWNYWLVFVFPKKIHPSFWNCVLIPGATFYQKPPPSSDNKLAPLYLPHVHGVLLYKTMFLKAPILSFVITVILLDFF